MLQKWLMTIRINLSTILAYRFNFFLTVIGPALVFFFVKYSFWTSIYKAKPGLFIQGYSLENMLSYQLLVLIVGLLAQSPHGMRIADDIRLGKISAWLLYPFSFFEFHTASFLSLQMIQFIIVMTTLLFCILGGFSLPFDFILFAKGTFFCIFVSFFWFGLQFFLGLTAFWLEQTWVLRVLFSIVAQFFSGALIPLELFPHSLQTALYYSPFPWLTWAPVKIFMGEQNLFFPGIMILGFWFLLIFLCARSVWKRGIMLYTGAGM